MDTEQGLSMGARKIEIQQCKRSLHIGDMITKCDAHIIIIKIIINNKVAERHGLRI